MAGKNCDATVKLLNWQTFFLFTIGYKINAAYSHHIQKVVPTFYHMESDSWCNNSLINHTKAGVEKMCVQNKMAPPASQLVTWPIFFSSADSNSTLYLAWCFPLFGECLYIQCNNSGLVRTKAIDLKWLFGIFCKSWHSNPDNIAHSLSWE